MSLKEENHSTAEQYLTSNLTENNGIYNKADKLKLGFVKQGNTYDKDLQNYNMAAIEEWVAAGFGTKTDAKIGTGTIRQMILDLVYPVGSIYISATDQNPGNTLGGTWKRIARGRTLIGFTDKSDNYIDGQGELPSGINSGLITETQQKQVGAAGAWQHQHNASSPSHGHPVSLTTGSTGGHTHNGSGGRRFATVSSGAGISDDTGSKLSGTGGKYPFLTSGDWQAHGSTDPAGDHAHSVSGNTGLSGVSVTVNLNGSTNNTLGVDIANLPPCLGVYFWQREP